MSTVECFNLILVLAQMEALHSPQWQSIITVTVVGFCYHAINYDNCDQPSTQDGNGNNLTTTRERVQDILRDIPDHVTVVAAAKGTTPDQVREAVQAGITVIGGNYFAEIRRFRPLITSPAQWHFIGRLRSHDIRLTNLRSVDAIQTIDSLELARRLDEKCGKLSRVMPVFIEVNSAREPQKAGVPPEAAESLIRDIAPLTNVKIVGLMTMGPLRSSVENYRPFFSKTRQLYEHISALDIPRVHMEQLSMGMSDSYEIAIEEGATMVRLGTSLFGAR